VILICAHPSKESNLRIPGFWNKLVFSIKCVLRAGGVIFLTFARLFQQNFASACQLGQLFSNFFHFTRIQGPATLFPSINPTTMAKKLPRCFGSICYSGHYEACYRKSTAIPIRQILCTQRQNNSCYILWIYTIAPTVYIPK
jgi:hypothetical protein